MLKVVAMHFRNTASVYGLTARSFHWLTALLVVGLYCAGYTMVDMDLSPTKLKLYSYHKWAGVTVFSLAVLRLAWRWYSPPPPLPAHMRPWEHAVADMSHRLLYLLLFLVPLSGWLMSSAKGFQTVYFGLWPIPDALAKNPDLGATLDGVHYALNSLLLIVVSAHVAAALKHHFIDRDSVLARMTPGLKAPKES